MNASAPEHVETSGHIPFVERRRRGGRETSRAEAPISLRRPSRLRILMADHHAGDVALTLDALVRAGIDHDARVVTDGAAVRSLLHPGRTEIPAFMPDMIVLAVDLPCNDIMRLYREIRTGFWTRQTEVVFLTNAAEARVARRYRSGDNTQIRTPLEFVRGIDDLGAYWGIFALLPPVF